MVIDCELVVEVCWDSADCVGYGDYAELVIGSLVLYCAVDSD